MRPSLLWPAGLLVLVALLGLAYCEGGRSVHASDAEQTAKQIVHAADTVRLASIETVTVRLKAQARVDSIVRVLRDTQVVIQTVNQKPETVTVAPQIVTRIVTDDATITALRTALHADSTAIMARDRLLALPVPRSHWGIGLGLGYACNPKGCGPGISAGIVWRF